MSTVVRPEKYGLTKVVTTSRDNDVERNPTSEREKHQADLKVIDAVWGEIKEGGPNYRNLGWWVRPWLRLIPGSAHLFLK